MAKQVTERKPAPVVKCKYCEWKGSARGLFTHVRLGHPGIKEKPPVMTHPYDVNSNFKAIVGSLNEPKRVPKGKKQKAIKMPSLEDMALAAFVLWVIKTGFDEHQKKKALMQSRVLKLNNKRPTERDLNEIVASLSGFE